MQFRKFGKTDLMVSEIGFGAWAIGGGAMVGDTAIGWGTADDRTSIKAIHTSLDRGINFFDTADIYGLGHSETLLGKELGKNKEVVIASKVGNVARNGVFTSDYDPAYIAKACEASLRRLRRDTIDYYQLHTAKLAHLQQNDCIAAMELLQKKGNIRYWGISLNTFYPEPEAEYLLSQSRGDGFQLVLNMLNQRALPLVKNAQEAHFGVIARMPLQFGLLTGKFDSEAVFPPNDHRKKRLPGEFIKQVNNATAKLWLLCEKYHCDKTTLALSFPLSYPGVSVVIPGIRTPEQAISNTKPVVTLSPEDQKFIEEEYEQHFVSLVETMEKLG